MSDMGTSDVAITVSEDERTIIYETLRALMPGEKLDVRVQFPHGPVSYTHLLTASVSAGVSQERAG